MAFILANWDAISAGVSSNVNTWFSYKNASDVIATIKASGYFNNRINVLGVGDIIHAQGTTEYALLRVTSVTTDVAVAEYAVAALDDNSVTSDHMFRSDSVSFQYTGTWKQTVTARPSSAYAYMHEIDADEYMTGGAAEKTYMLGISGERPSGSAATGDSNDAIIKMSYSNYAACDSNFIMRGLNSGITNRSGGTLGLLEGGAIGAQNKGGATSPTIRSLTLRSENYGTNATEFGVLDVNCSDEVGAATLRFGARIRNTDASAIAAMSHGLLFSSTATNGFDNAITVQDACDTFADFDDATGAVCTESGSVATTWKCRIKFVSPDGTDVWVNGYSTSNA